jgi:alpha-beta hydrolase superfamily lysophospholipase
VKTRRVGLLFALGLLVQGCGDADLEPWHRAKLEEEFSAARADEVRTFEDYQQLEGRLFAELEEKVYARVATGPAYRLVRYSAGSSADPRVHDPDWNRSFELVPEEAVGGALLLHGMSDSPYSLRALAESLAARGYRTLGLRMPGHGTAPSGLRHVRDRDVIAATRLGMAHLASTLGERPIHLVGYSTGGSLALDFALEAMEGEVAPVPASLVLISPAIRIHASAALASLKHGLSFLPGLGRLAWLQIMPEFDPYKYNSFATNAGDVVHSLTRSVDRRLMSRLRGTPQAVLPPMLVFKSTVDSTVTTEAVVERLLGLLPEDRHELVLFDINRAAAKGILLSEDPAPLTAQLMDDPELPFALTLVTNEHPETTRVAARRKPSLAVGRSEVEARGLAWPPGVISLSHVALSIPPDDPLYGRRPPENEDLLFLGEMAIQGERGVLALPADWLLRIRYNPFYDFLEARLLDWLEEVDGTPVAR